MAKELSEYMMKTNEMTIDALLLLMTKNKKCSFDFFLSNSFALLDYFFIFL
jgi:hypothetical protein